MPPKKKDQTKDQKKAKKEKKQKKKESSDSSEPAESRFQIGFRILEKLPRWSLAECNTVNRHLCRRYVTLQKLAEEKAKAKREEVEVKTEPGAAASGDGQAAGGGHAGGGLATGGLQTPRMREPVPQTPRIAALTLLAGGLQNSRSISDSASLLSLMPTTSNSSAGSNPAAAPVAPR